MWSIGNADYIALFPLRRTIFSLVDTLDIGSLITKHVASKIVKVDRGYVKVNEVIAVLALDSSTLFG
ncbi:hypothetical protein ACHAWC_009177 [Mediolabrus comicus]